MGEQTWTTIEIGGQLKNKRYQAFAAQVEDLFNGQEGEAIAEALKDGGPIRLEGERNYGNGDEIEDLCREFDLTYTLTWCAVSGQFHAGGHHWRPGMEQVYEFAADDSGGPVIGLHSLQELIKELGSGESAVSKIISDFEMVDNVPPFSVLLKT